MQKNTSIFMCFLEGLPDEGVRMNSFFGVAFIFIFGNLPQKQNKSNDFH